MNPERPIPFTAEQILSADIISSLSPGTVTLFTALWNEMRNRNIGQIVRTPKELTRRRLLTPDEVTTGLGEMAKAGIMQSTLRHGVIIFRITDPDAPAIPDQDVYSHSAVDADSLAWSSEFHDGYANTADFAGAR